MCGIAGIHIFNPGLAPKYTKIENAIDSLFSAIDHRGGDATGIVAISDDGEVVWQKASCNAFEFYKERKNIPWAARDILLHTRMATQGSAAFPENNHPIRRGSVYVVHNGHIWNDDSVFKKTGRERYGQVDSEAIAAVISKHGIMKTHRAMEEVAGAAAIGVIDESNPGVMVLARGASSPLMFYRNENIAVFASTKDAVKKAWKVLYGTSPKDNKIMDVAEGTAIYLENTEVSTERFIPDDYYYSRPRVVSSYKDHGYSGGGYYTINSPRTKFHGWDDSDKKLDHDGPNITYLCEHGCNAKDCEICNPDDEYGSYLPIKADETRPLISSGEGKGWLNAVKCELCDLWFAEDEVDTVKDWEDEWLLCSGCLDELADVIGEVHDLKTPYPLMINGERIDEDAALTWLTDSQLDYA